MIRGLQQSPDGGGDMVTMQGPDGKPLVMLTRQGTWTSDGRGGGGPGPAVLPFMRTPSSATRLDGISEGQGQMGGHGRNTSWDTGQPASSNGQHSRQPSEMDASPSTERRARTATWLGRNAVYEMP